MSAHELGNQTPRITLEASADELRRRCEAVARLQGGSTYYQEELGIFQNFAREENLYLPAPPPELSRPPDEEGNEHQVWYIPDSQSYFKATWPDFFGMRVVHRHDEEPKASPIAYLDRWRLHNDIFGDRVEFLGVLETADGIRLLIRQPAITGVPATLEQIETFFTGNGLAPVHRRRRNRVLRSAQERRNLRHPSASPPTNSNRNCPPNSKANSPPPNNSRSWSAWKWRLGSECQLQTSPFETRNLCLKT